MSPFEWAFLALIVLACWGPTLAFIVSDVRRVLARRRLARDERLMAQAYRDVRDHR